MSGKNLTFKLVMDADTKGFDAGTKASKDNWESFISVLNKEAEKLKAASAETSKEVSKIIPDDLQKKADQAKGKLGEVSQAAGDLQGQATQAAGKIDSLGSELQDAANKANKAGFEIGEAIPGDAVQLAEMLGNKFFIAAKEIEALGDKSTISAGELRAMSSAGEQGLNELNLSLKAAQAELVRLQSTDGTLQDIEIAKGRVLSIQDAIKEASSAFNYYQDVAVNAMKGVDGATQSAINQVQRFSSVDLSSVVGEAQTASRAIESMGDGASISTKEIERVGQLGASSINILERELQQATIELKSLSQSTDAVPLGKFTEASNKVNALEDALSLTKNAYTDFQTKASAAMGGVSSSTDKASNSATQAGHAIYAALGKAPPTAINDAIANLSRKLEDFKANSKMPAEEVARVTRLTEQEIARLKSELDGVDTSSNKANAGMGTLSRGMDVTKFAATALVGAMAALGIGLGIRELAQAADSYTNLSARINIATKEGGDFTSAMAGVHQVALATNSSLDATGSLFTRLNTVGKEMGMTQQNTLDLTKTINQAIQTSGGTAEAGEAAITQLIQAMQGGVLRGEEFNSIMENGYGVAEALAKGLGVTTGELRKMAENGELGAERVYKALLSQKDAVQQTYDSFPLTVSNALQKIATSWQILIGEVDQANGASATAAQWLSTLADNMSLLKPIIDDIGDGFTRFSEYYSNIYDQGTIDSLKTTLISIYDTIKTLFNTVLEVGEAFHDVFSDALSSALGFTDGLYPAGQQVSGFQKFVDLLNLALGFLNDGFKTIGIGVNLFTGVLYGLAAAWYEFKSILSWGDVKEKALANMEAMRAKSQEYFDKGFEGAKNFKSKMVETAEDISKTDKQKNQERIADSQQTLTQLKTQEEAHKASYKALNNERIQAEQQLFEARKSGNQAAIDLAVKGLAEIDAKEKAYQAESQKITEAKIQAAQVVASAMIKSADAAGMAQLKVLNAQLAAQGLQAEFDSTGKVIVKAMDDGAKATENQGNATDKARKAATALGLDLDASLNKVSAKFKENGTNVDNFVAGLKGLGVEGKQAGDVTYEAWQKWTEEAKSQAEIDLAKKGLIEFGNQGVLSAKQVEMGMRYLDEVNGKLPQNISEVEKAYKLLGITSREEAGKMADAQMKAFNVMQNSGTASAEQIKQALVNMSDKIYASGDAAKIAWYESKLGASGLATQVDTTGKAVVKSMDEWSKSNDRVRNSAERIGDGYRHAGSIAREEAKSSTEAWRDAVAAASKQFDAEMKRQSKSLSNGIYNYNSYSKADVLSQLKSKGYSDKEAEKLVGTIWSEAMAADRAAKEDGLGKDGNLGIKALINQEFDAAAAKGLTTQHGTNKINDLLRQMTASNLVSTGPSTKPVDINSLAPNVSTPVPSTPTVTASKSVNYNISFGGQTLSLSGSAEQESMMNQLISQLKTQAKST